MSVYIITCREAGQAKIGSASNPLERLRALQTGSPLCLMMEAIIPGDCAAERALHLRFAVERTRGEWFTLSDRLECFIKEFASGPYGAFARKADALQSEEGVSCALVPLFREIVAFCGAHSMSPTAFGSKALGDPPFVAQLREGRDCKMSTVERCRAFMADERAAPSAEAAA